MHSRTRRLVHPYGTKDVERILGLPRGAAAALVRKGLLNPHRGRASEYRFSFQDLIILRVARSLAAARIPSQRINRSLTRLRRQLPNTVPLSGLSISAVGDEIVVREGAAYWESRSGQYVLQFDVLAEGPALRIFDPPPEPPSRSSQRSRPAELSLFETALALESDPEAAVAAYRRCLESEPQCIEARVNCGRLLHQLGALHAAEQMYRGGDVQHDATLLFNLGVLLEDMERVEEAREMYQAALAIDAELADAHYNLAILSERRGRVCEALRHLNHYRRLERST